MGVVSLDARLVVALDARAFRKVLATRFLADDALQLVPRVRDAAEPFKSLK